jgi:hypothetical protein
LSVLAVILSGVWRKLAPNAVEGPLYLPLSVFACHSERSEESPPLPLSVLLFVIPQRSGGIWLDSETKCNKFREQIQRDSRSSAVGKWETLFVFHLFHGFFLQSPGSSG